MSTGKNSAPETERSRGVGDGLQRGRAWVFLVCSPQEHRITLYVVKRPQWATRDWLDGKSLKSTVENSRMAR